ncbi:hypothetical protein [Azospirillum sp. BE72]|uniref:hypothetical protein n=1 Tax=Azospirillum sp. BE72 TaxID=2817776 RepID=UPI00285DA3C4|nr:hypothetical protein [Azospirillum sp. BE72]MDR6775647.1 hypothetical protein [Azospirillum sp. BE72]
MPEPNVKDPAPISYGFDSLDRWRERGSLFIEFWCVGGEAYGRRCEHREAVPINNLIRRVGPGTSLLMLARRSRCKRCGKRGCHVQPAEPPVQGQPGYRDWLREEMIRCQRFLVWAREHL